MGKLIMWNMMTLDGYFEGPGHDISWHEACWGEELEAFSIEQGKAAGALLFGRATYELMAGHWSSAKGTIADFMNALPKIVASRSLKNAEWNNTRIIEEDVAGNVAKLKRDTDKDIYLFGSANLAAELAVHGLFDEIRIGLNPVLLGEGTPLFEGWPKGLQLELIDTRPLKIGAVILFYRPKNSTTSA